MRWEKNLRIEIAAVMNDPDLNEDLDGSHLAPGPQFAPSLGKQGGSNDKFNSTTRRNLTSGFKI